MREEKECLNCGKKFIPTCHKTRQKYCSNECRYRYNNAKRYYGQIPVNICPECGDKVDQRECGQGRWRRFCSDGCRVKYHQKKVLKKRRERERPKQICPNCGKEYEPEWAGGTRRFCSGPCRIEWWAEYRKAHPPEDPPATECGFCGAPLAGTQHNGTYCSRFCYLLAMDGTHVEEKCEWCGEVFTDTSGQGRRYCSRSCAASARFTQEGLRRGSHRISADNVEEWKKKLTQAARAAAAGRRGKRVRLVCGAASMYTGLDGLAAIVRYHLKLDPYDGSVYVFRDKPGTMLKYIEWDGQSFQQGKRRAQSGTYPWPKGQVGEVVEISEKEFDYLLERSIVPFKAKKNGKKGCDD